MQCSQPRPRLCRRAEASALFSVNPKAPRLPIGVRWHMTCSAAPPARCSVTKLLSKPFRMRKKGCSAVLCAFFNEEMLSSFIKHATTAVGYKLSATSCVFPASFSLKDSDWSSHILTSQNQFRPELFWMDLQDLAAPKDFCTISTAFQAVCFLSFKHRLNKKES